MAIQSIDMSKLRNGEFLQFTIDVLAIVDKKNPNLLNVVTHYNLFKTLSDHMESLFKLSQGSMVTAEIEQLDQRRDNAITGISLLVQGYGYSSNAAVQQAAKLLANHLAIFGSGIAKDNYLSETSTIRNIIDDWANKPGLAAALTALGLDSWKTELEAANNAFSEAYTRRNEELAGASPDKLKTKRLEAQAAYYKLRDRLNSHFDINDGAEPWAGCTALINQTIENYNSLLNRRGPAAAETAPTPAVA